MKKKQIVKGIIAGLLGIQLLATSGCLLLGAAAIAGAAVAGTAWYMGELSGTENGTPEQIKDATVAAFKQLNIQTTSATANAIDGKVIGKTTGGEDVTVTAKLDADGKSKVAVKVGSFGDQDLSVQIYNAMRKNLSK